MNVKEMVVEKLRALGARGLANVDGECGCPIAGLSPADCMTEECEAARLATEDELREWTENTGEDCFEGFVPLERQK